MKNLKKLFLFAVSGTFVGCVQLPKPGLPIFKDKSGLTWLAASDELAMNGCANARNEYDRNACRAPIAESSPAERICLKFKARLPTESEIDGLVKSFDHDTRKPSLTPKGIEQLQAAFGSDDWSDEIWTSTLAQRDPALAVAWTAKSGKRYENRYVRRVVRCVR